MPKASVKPGWRRQWKWWALIFYALLLIISHTIRFVHDQHPDSVSWPAIEVQPVSSDKFLPGSVRIAFDEYDPPGDVSGTPVVLIHGSPGDKDVFKWLSPGLAKGRKVIVPDLPGFGDSTMSIPDYSFRAHAYYVLELLDRLGIRKAHFVGFSMGGGVVLNIANIAPDRVESLTMLSALSVQEMELLGDYNLNHAVHGLQLAEVWLIREGLPDFGLLGDTRPAISYARNFYDSDQRPLRSFLKNYDGPMLILHGRNDELVPVQAAIEDSRLVPQSELVLFDRNHFMVFDHNAMLLDSLGGFLQRVDSGKGVVRSKADPGRVALSEAPFDPSHAPRAIGMTAGILWLLLAGATLISEDLACISAGVLVAQGRLGFVGATVACFIGIYGGDLLLFMAGRYLGRAAVRIPPIKWLIRPEAIERSSAWLSRNGARIVLSSRFVPGARLPTYFAAGLLRTDFWRFAGYFFIACAAWTPSLVGLSAGLGAEVLHSVLLTGQSLLLKLAIVAAAVFLGGRLVTTLANFRSRRLLICRIRRVTNWEFWPPYVFYIPVAFYICYLALKYRGLTLFTLANPVIPGGGFIGESKSAILEGLGGGNDWVARFKLLRAGVEPAARTEDARAFMLACGLRYPVVLKPDAGQRGSGVAIVKSDTELEDYLTRSAIDVIIQEYVDGPEFGVFYSRLPDARKGQILSITEKLLPVVTGDGTSTLEELILKDERAVCMARFHLAKQSERLAEVPASGQEIGLGELGTHCRGAQFCDGSRLWSAELEEAFDRIAGRYRGFHFGRFDLRARTIEDFKNGTGFKIIELNGVTSESGHIYDPKGSLTSAYKAMFRQWRLAFEIGAQNRARGARPASVGNLLKSMAEYKQLAKFHG